MRKLAKPGTSKEFKDFVVEARKRIDGVRRWEIASEKMQLAREFRELGKKYHDTERAA